MTERRVVPPPVVASRADAVHRVDIAVRDVGVVIVAGGSGARTGGELKQFRWVAGKPALLHSVQAFMARETCVPLTVRRTRSLPSQRAMVHPLTSRETSSRSWLR